MHSIHNIYLEASVAGCVYRYMTRVPHARHVFCIENRQKTCLKLTCFIFYFSDMLSAGGNDFFHI